MPDSRPGPAAAAPLHDTLHEFVFGDDRAFDQCHASSLARLTDGRLACVWFGGTKEGKTDVAIWGAVRETTGWSQPQRLAKVRQSPHWNPVLFLAPNGRLWLFFKVGDRIPGWETWVMTSDDAGGTWSEPRELVPGDRGGRGPVKNKPIVLTSGAWLAPASIETDTSWDVFADRSEDNGVTWCATPFAPIDHATFGGKGAIQPTLWESRPGHVHMLVRSSCARICRSDSSDDGRTWSPLTPTELPNNNSGIDLARLDHGALVLAYNPIASDWGQRTPLTLAVSHDNGRSWKRFVDLETAEGEYSYPTVIADGDRAACSYTWRRRRVRVWHGPVPEAG